MDVVAELTKSSDPIIALLAALNVMLSTVVVYQWNYTVKNTVPKWIWDQFVEKVDTMMNLVTRLDERVK